MLGEALHDLHVEAVLAPGDEVGVGEAERSQDAVGADLVEVSGGGGKARQYDEEGFEEVRFVVVSPRNRARFSVDAS